MCDRINCHRFFEIQLNCAGPLFIRLLRLAFYRVHCQLGEDNRELGSNSINKSIVIRVHFNFSECCVRIRIVRVAAVPFRDGNLFAATLVGAQCTHTMRLSLLKC